MAGLRSVLSGSCADKAAPAQWLWSTESCDWKSAVCWGRGRWILASHPGSTVTYFWSCIEQKYDWLAWEKLLVNFVSVHDLHPNKFSFFWPYDMSTMSFACGTALYRTYQYHCRAMTEYWLISAPGEKTCQQTFDRLNQVVFKQKHAFSRTFETQDNLTQATSKNQLSTNWKFHIPDLKVGLWILARPS